ncbi:uncharacterized protein AB9X84_014426 isoform 3-T3 [Acanthopagrus schlegelii]
MSRKKSSNTLKNGADPCCRFQDLVLTVNHTTNSATCSARGGYPAAQVSWKGLNRSSDEELDLQDAETFLQPDPTEKTFSFTNSVNVTGLKSVTCVVYNPHSHETITRTEKIDTEEGEQKYLLPIKIIAPVVIIALIAISCVVLQKSPVMLAVVFPLLLLLAPILGQRPQLLHVAVGGSVLIPCSLPGYPHNLKWFYWQEDEYLVFHWDGGKTIPVQNNKYKDRYQVFNSEFSSGNISIRLDNISLEDDEKTFFAYVKFYDEQKKVFKHPEERCRSMLQVSAPYQDLVLTVNHTTNSATCSARGGYPAAQVSWKGLNRSSDEELDLQDAETFLQPDPTEKTFSFTSSVNVTGLKSVTCVVYNPHSNKTITGTEKIDTEEGEQKYLLPIKIIAPVVIIVLIAISCVVLQKSIFAGPQDQRKDEEGARESTQPSVPGSPVS